MKNGKSVRQIAIIAIAILILFIPIINKVISKITKEPVDVKLKGFVQTYEKPAFEADRFLNGGFQQDYENWFNSTLQPRGALIKLHRQTLFSMFQQGRLYVGKDNYLYEQIYIDSELCLEGRDYSLPEKQQEMQNYVQALSELNEKLNSCGKTFVVYITPSKAHWCYDKLQDDILLKKVDGITCGDYFRECISKTDITYIDTPKILESKENPYPVFYKTGTHWSCTAEQEMNIILFEKLKELTGKNYLIPTLGEVVSSDMPFYRDHDIADLENLIFEYYDDQYYCYEWGEIPEDDYDSLNLFIQGGSFTDAILLDYFEKFPNNYYCRINYNEFQETSEGIKRLEFSYDNADLYSALNNCDVVVIEINEANMFWYSNGFAAYLNDYMDTYLASLEEVE